MIDIEESKELCGGTHISDLGKIGLFRISKEGSISAGVRRIEAVTGEEAEAIFRASDLLLDELSAKLKVTRDKLSSRVDRLVEENRELSQELKAYRQKALEQSVHTLLSRKESLNRFPALLATTTLSPEDFKTTSDLLMGHLVSGVMVLVNVSTRPLRFADSDIR